MLATMTRRRNRLAVGASLTIVTAWLTAAPAHAEKADRDKPINIVADKGFEDNKKQEAIFNGNVVMTQGTFRLEADKVTVRRDKQGFDHAVATGNPARFRQKQDGVEEWVQGHAQRIEFDGSQDTVKLFDSATIKRGNDQISSSYIQYNTATEVMQAYDPRQKPQPGGDSRVRLTIQPKSKGGAASAQQNPGVPLQPADSTRKP